MNFYQIHEPNYSGSFEAISKNGFAYTSEQSGYYDLIKKGHPKPSDPRIILAELYSTQVPPVLWATLTTVWSCAFLVTDKLLKEFLKMGLSGFEVKPVEIAKVASKGKVKTSKKEYSGEPEDLIYKRKNYLKEMKDLPILWGVTITGEMLLKPKDETLQDRMQPFVFAYKSTFDLFYTVYNNKRHGEPILCSDLFRSFLVDNRIENIAVDLSSEIWLDTKET